MANLRYLALSLIYCFLLIATPCFAANNQEEKVASDLLSKEQVESLMKKAPSSNSYLKLEDDAYVIYQKLTEDKNYRNKLFKNSPVEKINYLLTNDQKVFEKMTGLLKNMENSGTTYDGHRFIGGSDGSYQLDNITVYQFWFMKIPRNNSISNGSSSIYIDWPIFIGHYHRYRPHYGFYHRGYYRHYPRYYR